MFIPCIHLSSYLKSTSGFVAIESLASGVPVVAVAAGGLVDLIDDGTTGYLAENNDNMKDFVEKVKILVADKGKRDNYSTAAVQWAAGWSWEV